jgi:subtilase family protein/fervidolysin-like protein/HYDIN/CFA65/VesB family protein
MRAANRKTAQPGSRRFGFGPLFFFVVLTGCFIAGPGFAAQTPFDIPAHVPDELIVRFRAGVSESDRLRARSMVLGSPLRAFRIVEGLEVIKIPAGLSVEAAIDQFRQHQDVLYAEPNYIVHTTSNPNDPSFSSLWGLQNTGQAGGTLDADIDATDAWNITTGSSSVVVAVIDTGIDYNHQDLSANLFRNAADCNLNGIDDDGNGFVDDCFGIDAVNNDSDPMDDHSHGTHVAGTIGAAGNNGVGVVGVNWNVKIMACKFLDYTGSGYLSDAIDCLEYVARMKDRGVNIIATNNSWGGGWFSEALFDAIDAHRQRGILFIAAAGNAALDNDSALFYPASYYLPNVISVAATDRIDGLAFFSNYGRRSVHLGAPGHQILSTTPANTYSTFSGTSMATPHVTGVAALLKAQDPARDWRAIKNLLLAGGDGIPSMANTIAQKRLNAFGALSCSNSILLSRLRPIDDSLIGSVGTPIDLAALHINCANPAGEVAIAVSPGGQIITLLDDGIGIDQAAGDGIYSGQFTPAAFGTFTLTFSNGDIVTVAVPPPTIGVAPAAQDFGFVNIGSSAERNFFVQNSGGGILSGSASTVAPFSIVAGSPYSLGPGESQTVTVRFSPTAAGPSIGEVIFSGGAGATRKVTGTGVVCTTAPITLGESRAGTLNDTDCAAPHRPGSFADLYTFSATAGQQIRINMNAAFISVLFVIDPSGNVVAWGDNSQTPGRDTYIPWNALSGGSLTLFRTGVYTIEATSYFSGVTGDYSIYLTLANGPQRLTVTKTGNGSGSVVSSPIGIDCGSVCAAEYTGGWVVDLIARPAPNSIFAGFYGPCSGGGNDCLVTMTMNRAVTAVFTRLLDVTAPDGKESWKIGSKQSIQWSSAWITGNVKIELSRDSGLSWQPIIKSTTNDGNQLWKVTKPATARARIRVCSVNSPWICDTSGSDFTIR